MFFDGSAVNGKAFDSYTGRRAQSRSQVLRKQLRKGLTRRPIQYSAPDLHEPTMVSASSEDKIDSLSNTLSLPPG